MALLLPFELQDAEFLPDCDAVSCGVSEASEDDLYADCESAPDCGANGPAVVVVKTRAVDANVTTKSTHRCCHLDMGLASVPEVVDYGNDSLSDGRANGLAELEERWDMEPTRVGATDLHDVLDIAVISEYHAEAPLRVLTLSRVMNSYICKYCN